MIYVYGILHHYLEFAAASITSILETASEPIHLTVIDSNSSNSNSIKNYFLNEMENGKRWKGKLDRFISFKHNVRGWGLTRAYRLFPPDYTEDFCVYTDLDIQVDFDWIAETRRLQKDHPITGYSLKMENYVPPNSGFSPVNFGTWLMGIKKDTLTGYTLKNLPHIDGQCITFAGNPGKSEKELYHMGWDTWKYYPELWEQKLKGTDWSSVPESFEMSVYG